MEWYKNWFSNMLPFDEPLIEDGISYRTPEHYYQAHKVMDLKERLEISQMGPHQAKKSLNSGKYKIREGWNDELKLSTMHRALLWKFTKGTTWYEKLKATEGEKIVETNNWSDFWWGVDLETGKGKNHLGRLLMEIRFDHAMNEIFQSDFCSKCCRIIDQELLTEKTNTLRYCPECVTTLN